MNDAPTSSTFAFDTGHLWLALVAIGLLVMAVLFVYALLRRHRDWIGGRLRALDVWLGRHVPRVWAPIQRRITPDAWHGLGLTVAMLALIASFYGFAVITEGWVDQETLYRVDQRVEATLDDALSPGMVQVVTIVTHLADLIVVTALGLLVAGVLAWRRHWWRLTAFTLVMLGGQAVMWTMKWAFGRERPMSALTSAAGASFPSGHSFTAMTFYGFLLFLTWRITTHDRVRIPVSALLVVVILVVGLSRILLSVHWVSDVLGGLTMGLAWLIASLLLTRALQARYG